MPKKQLRGVVVSNKMQKTAIVAVTRLKEHALYKKKYKVTTRYSAHDEKNECQIGDKVIIQECKPLSKNKSWMVLKKI
ncbi:MAG: 30S ribosomal protein S17 [Candidatus Portnoybacteria bacterium]|nr:30S ribosomal protein S17 [Candidatus Portnoybacteria bacterium]MDD4982576.1 30S ribosomal protein S17 [Candidatus Portnoybacteria bacterium]